MTKNSKAQKSPTSSNPPEEAKSWHFGQPSSLEKVIKTHKIYDLANANIMSKAKDYLEYGMVLQIDLGDAHIAAKVQGSVRKPYTVTLKVGSNPSVPEYQCSCPYMPLDRVSSSICKHVIAVALISEHEYQAAAKHQQGAQSYTSEKYPDTLITQRKSEVPTGALSPASEEMKPDQQKSIPWQKGFESPLERLLLSKEIQRAAYPEIVKRGEEYASRGKVLSVDLNFDHFSAEVAGSDDEPYVVKVEAKKNKGRFIIDSYQCSCPYGKNDWDYQSGPCKHVIAASMVAGSQYQQDREAFAINSVIPKDLKKSTRIKSL